MFVIGITGGIGSGKTTVSALLAEAGLEVISADRISLLLPVQESSAISELEAVFGSIILMRRSA